MLVQISSVHKSIVVNVMHSQYKRPHVQIMTKLSQNSLAKITCPLLRYVSLFIDYGQYSRTVISCCVGLIYLLLTY